MSNTKLQTPETDAYFKATAVKDCNHWASFARTLERERNEARAENDDLKELMSLDMTWLKAENAALKDALRGRLILGCLTKRKCL